jgi:hypothetical protein
MKRLKKILKWTAIGTAAAIAVLLLLNAYFVWSTGTRLERRLTELRQAGDPVQLEDLAHEPIPPEQNADVFLRRAAADLDSIQKELLALYPKVGYPTGDVLAGDQKKLDTIFASYPRVMPLLEQAAACPDHDPQLDVRVLPSRFLQPFMDQATKHRLLTRVLRARCGLLLSQGCRDDAIANQVLLLRLTRHWRREPLLFAYLLTAVCEQSAMEGVNQVLQKGVVSPASRQVLDRELALHDTLEGVQWALRSERAFSLSSTREMPGTSFWLTRGFVNDLMLRLIDVYDRFLQESSLPYPEVVSEQNAKARPGGGANPYEALATLLTPALSAAREPAERTRALSRCLRVLTALQARPPREGDTAPKLADLGLPAAVTTDPFDDQPLRIKQRPEGWIVYSVGGKLVDDGGKLDGKTDIGAGPAMLEHDHGH